MHIYIYIYIEREREREIYVYIYIYIYTHNMDLHRAGAPLPGDRGGAARALPRVPQEVPHHKGQHIIV